MEVDGHEAGCQSTPAACQSAFEPMESAAPRPTPRELTPHARLAPHHPRPPTPPLCAEVPGSTNPLDAEVKRVISVPDGVVVPPGSNKLIEDLTHGDLLRALVALEAGMLANGRQTTGRPSGQVMNRVNRGWIGEGTPSHELNSGQCALSRLLICVNTRPTTFHK